VKVFNIPLISLEPANEEDVIIFPEESVPYSSYKKADKLLVRLLTFIERFGINKQGIFSNPCDPAQVNELYDKGTNIQLHF
jgi:hypothetical protein